MVISAMQTRRENSETLAKFLLESVLPRIVLSSFFHLASRLDLFIIVWGVIYAVILSDQITKARGIKVFHNHVTYSKYKVKDVMIMQGYIHSRYHTYFKGNALLLN